MMDMSVSGGAVPVDGAPAKSNRPVGKDDAGSKGGFSDVLARTGDNGQGDEDAPDASAADGGALQGADDAVPHSVRNRPLPKPLIDLSQGSLKEQAAAKADVAKIAKTPKDELKTIADALKDGSEKAGTAELAEDVDLHVTKGAKPAKTENATKTNAEDADADAATDVLGLLKKDAADAPVVVAAAMHAQGKITNDDAKTKDAKSDGMSVKADARHETHTADAMAMVAAHGEEAPAPGVETADGKTFRLSRADGRGQSMDMHIGGARDAAEEIKGKDVENVTVLESRRYLGLAQNSASVTAAISGDREWAQAMQPGSALSNAAEWTSTGKVVNTLKIQMTPIDLGLVTATMRLSGDALSVDLKVETGAAYRQLKEDHGKILEALRSQGYAVDNVTISMAPVEKPDTGNQANAQAQSGQQSLQQGQGGEARERQPQTAQRADGGFNGAGETSVEDTASGAARSSVSGGVYL